MTALPAAAVALLQAIHDHLTPPWDQRDQYGDGAYAIACGDVKLAIAAILSCADERNAELFAALLNGHTDPPPPGACCQSCGATTGLDPVHVPARPGIAARVESYCHDATSCHRRRRAHLVATSAVTG